MNSKTLFSALTVVAVMTTTLFLSPIGEARGRRHPDIHPLGEAEHVALVDRVFGGEGRIDPELRATPHAGSTSSLVATQASGGTPVGGSLSPGISFPRSVYYPSWRRIDTFGIRETWGYTDPSNPGSSSIAFVFDTVVVPSAYQHCLRGYEMVTEVEARIVPAGGGATAILRSSLQPGSSSVMVDIPAALWQNAASGRLLAWTSSGNPAVDADAISDQEFGP